MPCSYIRIKPTYGNGESDSLCGKICDMHTYEKYAKYAATTYSQKTDIPNQSHPIQHACIILLNTDIAANVNVEINSFPG